MEQRLDWGMCVCVGGAAMDDLGRSVPERGSSMCRSSEVEHREKEREGAWVEAGSYRTSGLWVLFLGGMESLVGFKEKGRGLGMF